MKPRFFNEFIKGVKKMFYYYYFLLFIILCILAFICSTHFILMKKRFCMNEIEDYQWFNQWFPDTANGMLYDMSYSQKIKMNKLPESFTQLMDSDEFLDIGSGGGDASIFHLQQIFGKNVKIILSDLHPKIELWDKLITPNIDYIKTPFDATRLSEISFPNKKIKQISCFGSFHHMDENTIQKIFDQMQKKDIKILIVEPKRYSDIVQYLHILSLPIIGLLSYSIISLFGSAIVASNPLNSISRLLMVPFFMTFDHILGASRRYSLQEIETMAKKSNLKTFHYSNMMFDYYILIPVY